MSRVKAKGEPVRQFILENVGRHPGAVARVAAGHFKISRQAINQHLKKLVSEGALTASGGTKARRYKLASLVESHQTYQLANKPTEDAVWRSDIAPLLGRMPENVLDVWHYGFTEMFNNVIDHSEAAQVIVQMSKTATSTEVAIMDNGVGIFRKIQNALGLMDERHSVLELAKGKFTTDPRNHSGEGIFFASRLFDAFRIMSGGVYFSHEFAAPEDWILEQESPTHGTAVWMRISNHTSRTVRKIFDKFTDGDENVFNKTMVPVRLAQYGDDKLVSRSQAKRMLARVDRFRVVVFDFSGVDSIGQGFADEVFRVFAGQHPGISLEHVSANAAVKDMISRAKGGAGPVRV